MIRSIMIVAATMLVASSATADVPNANAQPKGANALPQVHGDKGDNKGKAEEKAAERTARKAKQHEAQKAQLAATLKGPADDALKQELKRHAERVARIDRIKAVATEAKDTDSSERAAKLLAKENVRHEKWMEKRTGTSLPTTTPVPAEPAKEGAK